MGPTDEDRPAAPDPPAQARLSQRHKGAIFSSGIEGAPVLSLSPLQTDPRSASASFEEVVLAMRQWAQIHRFRDGRSSPPDSRSQTTNSSTGT